MCIFVADHQFIWGLMHQTLLHCLQHITSSFIHIPGIRYVLWSLQNLYFCTPWLLSVLVNHFVYSLDHLVYPLDHLAYPTIPWCTSWITLCSPWIIGVPLWSFGIPLDRLAYPLIGSLGVPLDHPPGPHLKSKHFPPTFHLNLSLTGVFQNIFSPENLPAPSSGEREPLPNRRAACPGAEIHLENTW